jgi:hypothetical protein
LPFQPLRPLIVFLVILLGAPQALAADWGPWPLSKDSPFVAAGYKHDDDGALIVMCDTKTRLISLALQETRADWTPGTTMKFMTRADDGTQLNDDVGLVFDKTHLILKEPATWHLYAMGKATATFAVGTGEYARIFPAANFRKAIEPVLTACGDHW